MLFLVFWFYRCGLGFGFGVCGFGVLVFRVWCICGFEFVIFGFCGVRIGFWFVCDLCCLGLGCGVWVCDLGLRFGYDLVGHIDFIVK